MLQPGRAPDFLPADGIVLGALPEAEYEEFQVELEPGSWLALYTDGVTEARSPGGGLFGPERLLELLGSAEGLTPRTLAERVDRRGRGFSEGELTDDLSVLILRTVAGEPRALPRNGEARAVGERAGREGS